MPVRRWIAARGGLNCLREGFRDALSLPVRTNGSRSTSNFESDF